MAQKKTSVWRYLRHMWNSQDIRRKLLVTLGILAIFRLAANVPAPGIDHDALKAFTEGQNAGGNFLGGCCGTGPEYIRALKRRIGQ